MSQIDLKIGPKIKAFRRQLGLQANRLAEELSISPSYLNLIEGGKRKIDGDLLLKICEKLNIELSQLTSKDDINLENTLSEILDDKLFEDLARHNSRGIYMRDDHCDWGSSGMKDLVAVSYKHLTLPTSQYV